MDVSNAADESDQMREVKLAFGPLSCPYWIIGGWAVDLAVGRVRRVHGDVDVLIRASDIRAFADSMGDRKLELVDHQTEQSVPWSYPDPVEPGRHTVRVHGMRTTDVEVAVALSDGEDWVFHRGRGLRRPWCDLTRTTPSGLHFMAPEFVLLFKAREGRDKDDADFADLLPLLSPDQATWLLPRLNRPGAPAHPWAEQLAAVAGGAAAD